MNPFEFVIIIVAMAIFGGILRQRFAHRHNDFRGIVNAAGGEDNSEETRQLRSEVTQLKQRIQVLERIAVEKENSLAREIEQLRDR
jgi:hypothetical protein